MRYHAGLAHDPVFSPAVARAYRGMIVDVPLNLAALESRADTRIEPAAMRDALRVQYNRSAIVTVADGVPAELCLSADSAGSDAMELFVCADEDGTQVRLLARLDNLGKGAGGAAVQSLNLTGRTTRRHRPALTAACLKNRQALPDKIAAFN